MLQQLDQYQFVDSKSYINLGWLRSILKKICKNTRYSLKESKKHKFEKKNIENKSNEKNSWQSYRKNKKKLKKYIKNNNLT